MIRRIPWALLVAMTGLMLTASCGSDAAADDPESEPGADALVDGGADDVGLFDGGADDVGPRAADSGAVVADIIDTVDATTEPSLDATGDVAEVADVGSDAIVPDGAQDTNVEEIADGLSDGDSDATSEVLADASGDIAPTDVGPGGLAVLSKSTLVFRQGEADYKGTEDLNISIPAGFFHPLHGPSQFETDPDNEHMEWSIEDTFGHFSVQMHSNALQHGVGDNVGLLQFRDIFGPGEQQIPPGAKILSASLKLKSSFLGDPATVHRALVPWDESTRWGDFGAKPGPDFGTDMASDVEAITQSYAKSIEVNVQPSLATWSKAPENNHGWVLMPTAVASIIHIDKSNIKFVTSVKVHLNIKAVRRGEVVATLRHAGHTAVLLNRVGRNPCWSNSGFLAADFDVTIQEGEFNDIHWSDGKVAPLKGTFKPDAVCVPTPFCPAMSGGLCGVPADGDWVLTVTDEWVQAGDPVKLVSWSVDLSDTVTQETYSNTNSVLVPNRNQGGMYATQVWTSEAPVVADRPSLEVSYEPGIAFETGILNLWPDAGEVTTKLYVPVNANSKAMLKIAVESDDPSVVDVASGPVIFSAGGPRVQPLILSAGKPGQAKLKTVQKSGLADASLQVVVGKTPMSASPPRLDVKLKTATAIVMLRLPLGCNNKNEVKLSAKLGDPGVASFGGAGQSEVTFSQGGADYKWLKLDLNGKEGATKLVLSDLAGVLAPLEIPIRVTDGLLNQYDVYLAPYIQLGDAKIDAKDDHAALVWQTVTRRSGGVHVDGFKIEIREKGGPTWTSIPAPAPANADSTSRLVHRTPLPGLAFDSQYDYRVTHLRDGTPLPGGTYEGTFQSRKTGPFRFTAFGNSGIGSGGQLAVAAQLAKLDTDLHLLLGDNVYYYGEFEHYRSRVFEPYAWLMHSRHVMCVVGNHEYSHLAAVGANMYVPDNGPTAADTALQYYFDYGSVRFYIIYWGANLSTVGPWLLKTIKASSQKWNVVLVHEPPVTRDPDKIDRQEDPEVQEYILSAAVEGGADLLVAGAVHSWQRYLPITKVLPKGAGVEAAKCAGGKGTTLVYPGTGAWARVPPNPIPAKLPDPMASYIAKQGIGVFDIDGDKMTVRFIEHTGAELDKVVITKCVKPGDCACP